MDNKQQESSMSSGQRNTGSSDNNNNESSSNPISNELNSGMELARQLQRLLSDPNSQNMGQYYREQLVQGIIASFDRAVTIVQQTDQHQQLTSSNSMMIDSPNPATGLHNMSGGGMGAAVNSPPMVSGGGGSCMSESTVDHRSSSKRVDPREGSSKRKSEKRWVIRVQASPESGFEAPINEDGYNWRKYGQKEINGTKHQRGYYRCSLKSQGCNAKKLVQRCEDDNSIFLVTYRGQHTCQNYQSQVVHQPPNIIPSSPPSSSSGTLAPSSNYPTYIPTNNHYNPNQRETLISFKTWPTQQQPHPQQQSNIYHNQFHTPQNPSSSLGTNNSVFFHGSSSNNPIPTDLSVDQPPPLPAVQPSLPSSARMDQDDCHTINTEHSAGQQLQQASQPQGDHLPAETDQPASLQAADNDYGTDYGSSIFVRDFPFDNFDDDFGPSSVFFH